MKPGEWWYTYPNQWGYRDYYLLEEKYGFECSSMFEHKVAQKAFICEGCRTPDHMIDKSKLERKLTDLEMRALIVLFPQLFDK